MKVIRNISLSGSSQGHYKTFFFSESEEQNLTDLGTPSMCDSPLWVAEVRDSVTREFISSATLSSMRSKKIVPGLESEQSEISGNIPCLPVILLQRPGSQSNDKRLGVYVFMSIILYLLRHLTMLSVQQLVIIL